MSVGLQRLREDAEPIRQGAIDKGEDPAVVDAALALDERAAARCSPRATGSRPSATRRRKQIGEAIQGGAAPDGPEVAALQRRLDAGRRADRRASMRSSPPSRPSSTTLLLRIPNPADPDVPVGGEEANVTVREWGEQLPRTQPLVGEVGADAPAGGATWERRPHWELAEPTSASSTSTRGAKIAGSGFPVYTGARLALQRALINWFLDVHATRERLHRGLAAGRRQRGVRPRHRPDPGQGRPDVRRHARRPVPGADRRGPGHEPPPRRDPRGDRAADPLRRLLAVLPARGRRGRQGHPGHPARPPVRQGRDGPVREARTTPTPRSSG